MLVEIYLHLNNVVFIKKKTSKNIDKLKCFFGGINWPRNAEQMAFSNKI